MFESVIGAALGVKTSASTSVPTYTGGATTAGPMSLNLGAVSSPAIVVNQSISFSVSAIDSRDMTRALQEQKGTIAQVVAEAARGSSGFRRALAGA